MDKYLYKSRMSLINFDVFLWIAISILFSFASKLFFMFSFCILLFWIVFILGTRVYVYEDKIVYKVGFILRTHSSTILIKNISFVNCSETLIGKLFHYGDVVIETYTDRSSINLKSMKNASMLVENISVLMRENNQ